MNSDNTNLLNVYDIVNKYYMESTIYGDSDAGSIISHRNSARKKLSIHSVSIEEFSAENEEEKVSLCSFDPMNNNLCKCLIV